MRQRVHSFISNYNSDTTLRIVIAAPMLVFAAVQCGYLTRCIQEIFQDRTEYLILEALFHGLVIFANVFFSVIILTVPKSRALVGSALVYLISSFLATVIRAKAIIWYFSSGWSWGWKEIKYNTITIEYLALSVLAILLLFITIKRPKYCGASRIAVITTSMICSIISFACCVLVQEGFESFISDPLLEQLAFLVISCRPLSFGLLTWVVMRFMSKDPEHDEMNMLLDLVRRMELKEIRSYGVKACNDLSAASEKAITTENYTQLSVLSKIGRMLISSHMAAGLYGINLRECFMEDYTSEGEMTAPKAILKMSELLLSSDDFNDDDKEKIIKDAFLATLHEKEKFPVAHEKLSDWCDREIRRIHRIHRQEAYKRALVQVHEEA